jgi:ubiquinone/menaquinone biosynthesis C-methylase UbiE
MMADESIPVFDWFSNQFTLEARASFLEQFGQVLTSLFQPGDHVLDLCCGAGAVALYLAEHGAQVTGIDLAPGLIAMAREETARRGSQSTFIQGNVLTSSLGNEEYDLAVCLGNAVLDFPPQEFPRFGDSVCRALKPRGRFALGYRDGVLRVLAMREPAHVVEEGAEGQIERWFKAYDPVRGAYLSEYRHLVTGEVYEGTGYVYTGPILRILLEAGFDFDRSVRLGEGSFLDLYVKR